MIPLYPVFLDVRGRTCVVLGSGEVALARARSLVECDGRVRAIGPEPCAGLRELERAGRIELASRAYRRGDLAGSVLVLAERIGPAVVTEAFGEAKERGIPINVEDDVRHCRFHVPSRVRRGGLQIAISTSGAAPALAVRIREELEQRFGREYAELVELAAKLRPRVAGRHASFDERRARWYRLVDSGVLDELRAGRRDRARRLAESILGIGHAAAPEAGT